LAGGKHLYITTRPKLTLTFITLPCRLVVHWSALRGKFSREPGRRLAIMLKGNLII